MSKDDIKPVLNKVVISVFSILLTASFSVGGFALKEAYNSRINLEKVNTKIIDFEKDIENLNGTNTKVLIVEARLGRLEKDISEIKTDIKKLLEKD